MLGRKKETNNFTYIVGDASGAETDPMTLEETKPFVKNGQITGSTMVKRSDQDHWGTAADFPELGTKDSAWSPHEVSRGSQMEETDALTQEMEVARYSRPMKLAASWLGFIAACSFINAFRWALGEEGGYAISLEISRTLHYAQPFLPAWSDILAHVLSFGLAILFAVGAVTALRGSFWLYQICTFIYIGDMIVAIMAGHWITTAIHAAVVVFLLGGVKSYGELVDRPIWKLSLPVLPLTAAVVAGGFFLLQTYHADFEKVEKAAWATEAQEKWPQMVLHHDAYFTKARELNSGNACLAQMPSGDVVGVTVRHLLGEDGGVDPAISLRELNKTIRTWNLLPSSAHTNGVEVRGLYGSPRDYLYGNEVTFLELKKPAQGKFPVEPLAVRRKALTVGDEVYVVAAHPGGEGKQKVYPGKVISQLITTVFIRVEGKVALMGHSGAPVLDKDGRLVALLTGGTPPNEGVESKSTAVFATAMDEASLVMHRYRMRDMGGSDEDEEDNEDMEEGEEKAEKTTAAAK